jgi:hypothetical protein
MAGLQERPQAVGSGLVRVRFAVHFKLAGRENEPVGLFRARATFFKPVSHCGAPRPYLGRYKEVPNDEGLTREERLRVFAVSHIEDEHHAVRISTWI